MKLSQQIIAEIQKYRDPVSNALAYGALAQVKIKFPTVGYRTIQRYHAEYLLHGVGAIVTNKKLGRVGRKSKLDDELREKYYSIKESGPINAFVTTNVVKLP